MGCAIFVDYAMLYFNHEIKSMIYIGDFQGTPRFISPDFSSQQGDFNFPSYAFSFEQIYRQIQFADSLGKIEQSVPVAELSHEFLFFYSWPMLVMLQK
ncbi:hypothetical protein CW745_01265 [Psychromonas sp. psych-6C06]|nr:hypothetical protein CW745_01265 [Psychromonas sp. psych-6C06]